jgi:hypothetical protein
MSDQVGSNIKKIVNTIAFNAQLKELKKMIKKIQSNLDKLKNK